MPAHVSYDVTRLLTRLFTTTPNGIDRIDAGLAAEILAHPGRSGVILTPLGPRLLDGDTARNAVAAVAAHWGETASVDADRAYHDLVGLLMAPARTDGALRIERNRPRPAAALLRWLGVNAAALSHAPARSLPQGARYLNVSQFPLWMKGPFEWWRRGAT